MSDGGCLLGTDTQPSVPCATPRNAWNQQIPGQSTQRQNDGDPLPLPMTRWTDMREQEPHQGFFMELEGGHKAAVGGLP